MVIHTPRQSTFAELSAVIMYTVDSNPMKKNIDILCFCYFCLAIGSDLFHRVFLLFVSLLYEVMVIFY